VNYNTYKENSSSLYLDDGGISYQLKEASVRDASATPPTIGRRDITTQGVGNCEFQLSGTKQESRRLLSYYIDSCTTIWQHCQADHGIITSPRKIAERRTEKKGSMALIVCVNDTATLPRLMFVKRLPMVWTTARGRIARSWKIRTITADVHLSTLCAY
jgi:hypothetical protein